ncbi:MAG: hypothetical protein HYU66_20985 [Armatimonadetes bacterium]|nr:hypothetical protein [Armatimonadota bacterium]
MSRAGYRAVAEVKATYPSREEQLDEIRKQVKKYDQPLVGWPVSGSQPESHDVVLLTHHSRKAHFADFFSSWTVENGAEFNSPFCVVGFARVDQSGKFISLELQSGRMSDQGLRDRLHRAVYVAMHHLIINYVLVFYDADPPLPYVMAFLWMKVFADILSVEDYIAGREGAEPPTLTVNVRDLTERARAICRPSASWARMPELPRTEWIRDAMDGFVQLGYARKVAEDDAYAVPYKFIRDPQEEFTRKAAAAEQRAEGAARRPSRRAKPRPGPEQLSLFELDE